MTNTIVHRAARSLLVLLPVAAFQAHAADPVPVGQAGAEENSPWGLGLAVSSKKSPYRGVGNEAGALPLLSFDNKWVRVFGNQVDLKLPSYGPLRFSLRTQISIGGGYKSSDSAFLSGMEERKGALYIGPAVNWRNDIANVSLAYLKDVSGNSKGSVIKLGAEHDFKLGDRFEITPHVDLSRYDDKSVDYYYGVRADEATLARPRYAGKASVDVQAGVRFGYSLTSNQRLQLGLSATRLGSGTTDSPIVERKTLPQVRIGYLYTF